MAGKKSTPAKSAASKKRKRALEDDASNKRINDTFRSINRDEYEETLSQKSNQTSFTPETSQIIEIESSPEPPPSTADTKPCPSRFDSSELPPSTADTTVSTDNVHLITDITAKFIDVAEKDFESAYQRYKNTHQELDATSPRLLIACMGVSLVHKLEGMGYSRAGIFKAMLVEHNNFDAVAFAKAWKEAQESDKYELIIMVDCEGQPVDLECQRWEAWTTNAEALDKLSKRLEDISFVDMESALHTSYQIACRLAHELPENPSFATLKYGMRYLARSGYALQLILHAMALELMGRREIDVERAWSNGSCGGA
jgi:hypothetical protein